MDAQKKLEESSEYDDILEAIEETKQVRRNYRKLDTNYHQKKDKENVA